MSLTFLQAHKQIIESFLDSLLPLQEANHDLFKAMRYSVLNSGKRIRPALVYATGKVLQIPINNLHAAAAAVELIHCYSLIHDDLPAMDDDDLRRGLPTCHRAFDEATAILAGDALQSLAFQILATPELNPVSSAQQASMVAILAKAIGPAGMVLGQAEDMAAEKKLVSLDDLIRLHRHKTGALIVACIELGMVASDDPIAPGTKDALLDFARNLGLAFQIQDDVLDITSDDATLGKPVGSDQLAGKSTFPSLLGLDGAKHYANDTLALALQALNPLGQSAQTLIDLANYLLIRAN